MHGRLYGKLEAFVKFTIFLLWSENFKVDPLCQPCCDTEIVFADEIYSFHRVVVDCSCRCLISMGYW